MKVERKYINRLVTVLAAGCFALVTASCVKDDFGTGDTGTDTPETGERVRVELYTATPDYSAPRSRAVADEYTVSDTPTVLVFRGTDNNAVFHEASKAQHDGSKSTVMLAETANPSFLVIISNPPGDEFFNGTTEVPFTTANITAALTGKTLAQSESILRTSRLNVPLQTTRPYETATSLLPMSTVLYLPLGINDATNLGSAGSEIELARAVAKVVVTVDPALDGIFTLKGVGILNAQRNGTLFRVSSAPAVNSTNLTQYLKSQSGDGVTGMVTVTGGNTLQSPLYLYESSKNQGTALIIKGTMGSTDYYYKLPFFSNGEYLDILRNTNYIFNITEAAIGHTSMSGAIQSTGSNANFVITVTDSYSHDMVTNGQFYLGVTNSSLLVFDSNALSNYEALTIITSAHSGLVSSGKITYSTGITGTSSINLAASATTIGTTSVKINMPANVDEGTITLQIGGLRKVITVTRYGRMSATGANLELPHNDYVSCDVNSQGNGSWLSVSPDGVIAQSRGFSMGQPGKIYIMASANTSSSVRSGGEVYAMRKNDGRIKAYIIQDY